MLLLRDAEMKALREFGDLFDILKLIDKGFFDTEKRTLKIIKNLCKILDVSEIDTLVLLDRQERRLETYKGKK